MKKKNIPSSEERNSIDSPLMKAREAAGLTQEQAAERLGREPRSLRRYETGERLPRADVIQRMMRVYDCEFAELFLDELFSVGDDE